MDRARAIIGLAGIALALLLFGFIMFAQSAGHPADTSNAVADGIVVLTGTGARISEGGHLLAEGRGKRLLITGVNTRTSRADIMKLAGLDEDRFQCCVDLDYEALDTFGNATETSEWASRHGFNSLIVVTSSYHMPRSLAELERALPGVRFVSHPVVPKSLRDEAWWLNVRTMRILLAEYLKFLPVAVRLTLSRMFTPGAVAGAPPSTAAAN